MEGVGIGRALATTQRSRYNQETKPSDESEYGCALAAGYHVFSAEHRSAAEHRSRGSRAGVCVGSGRLGERPLPCLPRGGAPFYWNGDTGWGLFQYVSREDAALYLQDRKDKGFNGFLASLVFHFGNVPNFYGDKAWNDDEPSRPNGAYFQNVDAVLDQALGMGFYVGLLPSWGDKVTLSESLNPANAYDYGWFLGDRYRSRNGQIIWVIGGDKNPHTEEQKQTYRKIAEGIADGVNGVDRTSVQADDGDADYESTLMTYHPQPNVTSSFFYHTDPWLDFNMQQTGHVRRNNEHSYTSVAENYALDPAKPTLDGEPPYEDHGVHHDLAANGYFNDQDVRKAAYWSVFAGACGHVYGAHAVWQFASSRFVYPKFEASTRGWWNEEKDGLPKAKDLPGASDMVHLQNLVLSRPYLSRIPDQSLLSEPGTGKAHLQATRDASGDYAFVYVPMGTLSFTVEAERLAGEMLEAWWFNPRDGRLYDGEGRPTRAPFASFAPQERTFSPPSRSASEDWVLVLDNAAKSFAAPALPR